MLSRGTAHRLLQLHLFRLKIRHRWSSLNAKVDKASGRLTVRGGFSPDEDIAEGGQILQVISTNIKLPPGRDLGMGAGKNYEAAVSPYVETDMATELFGQGGFEVTRGWQESTGSKKRHQYASTLDVVRLKQQKGHRSGAARKVPDYSAEVFKKDASGGRPDEPTEVHAIEITLVAQFEDARAVAGDHKVGQFLGTLELFEKKYPTSPITFHFVSNGAPSKATRDFIENTVKGMGLAGRMKVIWRIVG